MVAADYREAIQCVTRPTIAGRRGGTREARSREPMRGLSYTADEVVSNLRTGLSSLIP